MIKFVCKCGEETKELQKATIKVIEGKVRTIEAVCSCEKYMQEFEKDFNGFPNLIRTEKTLSKRGDKMWDSVKEKLIGERRLDEPFK
jgi:hypothetical protein